MPTLEARAIMVEAILAGHFSQHSKLLAVVQLVMGFGVLVQGSHHIKHLPYVVLIVHLQGMVLSMVILVVEGKLRPAATPAESLL